MMKTEDQKIDALIKETLSSEEAAYYDQLDEKNLLQEFGGVFRGRYGWVGVGTTLMIFAFMGLGIYSIVQFNAATEVKGLVVWSLVILVAYISIAMLKIWNWMQMNTNDIKREIKRVEFQISLLAKEK